MKVYKRENKACNDDKEKPQPAEVQREELNWKKMTEQILTDTHKSKNKKHVILLAVGVAAIVISNQCFKMHDRNEYTFGGIVYILSHSFSALVFLSILAWIISAITKKFWFPVLAWLSLVVGIWSIVVGGFNEFFIRSKIEQNPFYYYKGNLQVWVGSESTDLNNPNFCTVGTNHVVPEGVNSVGLSEYIDGKKYGGIRILIPDENDEVKDIVFELIAYRETQPVISIDAFVMTQINCTIASNDPAAQKIIYNVDTKEEYIPPHLLKPGSYHLIFSNVKLNPK